MANVAGAIRIVPLRIWSMTGYSQIECQTGGVGTSGGLLVVVLTRRVVARSGLRGSISRAVTALGAVSLLAALAVVAVPAPAATAADARDFDPGYLISDENFYDRAAMTEAQIQAFLESKGAPCSTTNCLDVFTQTTPTRDATTRCDRYVGGANESAARILYKVQVACGISAKALLVTLQKEQGLITSSAPSDRAIRVAMGYGCPDTAPCDALYYGFFNQVYNAAAQFQRYRLNPAGYKHQVGVEDIYLHPNSFVVDPPTCGTKRVTIKNLATAGLYNYTPYTPNDSALANLYGTGDRCASYGNRNFWRYYTDWFGYPTGISPANVDITRHAGDNRYSTSVALSTAFYPNGAPTVYVAVGSNFPDGLAAAPAAARSGGPLLLTETGALPAVVGAEIARLRPQHIVVVGSEAVVSAEVYRQLEQLAPTIRRDAGADRFETARRIAAASFPAGAPIVFLATGSNFPDALAISGAAGSLGGPVLLVPEGARALDAPTLQLIKTLGAKSIVVAGSTAAISADYVESARAATGISTITRLGGDDRFRTAAAINEYAFPQARLAFLANGLDFPDALSAAAIAGAIDAPLHLSPQSCVPTSALRHLASARVERISLVGGPSVLGAGVAELRSC